MWTWNRTLDSRSIAGALALVFLLPLCHCTNDPAGSATRDADASFDAGTLDIGAGGAALVVWTHHEDNSRTGANLRETVLNTSNVNPNAFGLVFTRRVDGEIYAQPLYAGGLAIAGHGTRNVVFVATMHDTVYAFDADDPAASDPLWSVSLGPSVPATAVDNCQDITPEVGILATPVIDTSTHTLYVSAKTFEDGVAHFRLHALELETGVERFGGPVEIEASIPGHGFRDEGADGSVHFHANNQLQRPALTLGNGVVYLGFGGWCDRDVFHGWVMAYDAATLRQRAVWADTRNGYNGGVWQSGNGFAVDDSGDIYLETGDGHFDDTLSPPDLSDSLVRLHLGDGTLEASDWFTPSNQAWLDEHDFDLGCAGPMLLPGTSFVVGFSKQGMLYVVDRTHMGRFNASGDTAIMQSFLASYSMDFGHIHGSPVYWSGPNGPSLYIWPEDDILRMFSYGPGGFSMTPAATNSATIPDGAQGGFLTLSANGSAAGTGIVWALVQSVDGPDPNIRPGALRAFDASDVTHLLWSSEMMPMRDALGIHAKFVPPLVANGRVYAATFSNQLQVYGLLN